MNTDELIRALSTDRLASQAPVDRSIYVALLGGSVVTAVLFLLGIGVRDDAVDSLTEWRFVLKFLVTLGLALPAIALLLRLSRPLDPQRMPWWLLLIAPIALAIGVVGELLLVPASAWSRRLIGANAMHCLILIPLLSLAPLIWVFSALRRGAPARPWLAGAVSGLVCAGLAAALYALNCPDDSPLFLATWYVLAIGIVTLVASVIGARALRW